MYGMTASFNTSCNATCNTLIKTFMKRNILSIVYLTAVALFATACQENDFGTVDLSGVETKPETGLVYNHPCAMYAAADFARVKQSLANGTAPQPVKDEFAALKSNAYVIGDYGVTIHAHEEIVRGDATGTIEGRENYADAMRDAASAHQFGMLWLLTGDKTYADKALKILNTWASICKRVTSNDSNNMLAAGCQGFTFALAGEELSTYEGWSESDRTAFGRWMKEVFASKNYQFLMLHNSTGCGAGHYWSNWDLVNLCSYLQIGILTEDDDMVNFVIEYFQNSGVGNGSLKNLVLAEHNDPLGSGEKICQAQESGRDQGHAEMAAMVAAQLARTAWSLYQDNPEYNLDFFSANDNALLKMFEYVALTNLRDGTDRSNGSWLISASDINAKAWQAVGPWCNGGSNHEASHAHTQFADDKGRGAARPGWETIYQHYRAQGITTTKYVKAFADKLRPECGAGDARYGSNSGAFDQIGWGTLMIYQP